MTLIPIGIDEPVFRVNNIDRTGTLFVSRRENHVTSNHVEKENRHLALEALERGSTFARNGVVLTLGYDGNEIWI